ncbi:toprim domain-containing protein [Stenotrophomonas maltophilia]|uniref:VapE domain-containing protein n=1 Tax=Stenotrophomonas maltophilia TaxID=40324 RepID=UPI00200F31C9|nr:VapE domain-containing protein [Stenotrophomonas maltophilia]ELF4099396.1 toprim domain-containing protein [Stenotrophomonas maltophilia]UQA71435.1 toprim domain-containing protein [Stenotrophomonas maltophilia]WQI21968.1 VapE family protein [Stenotrophomonas maltophilia]
MHTPHPAQDIVPAFLQAMHAHGIVPDARGRDALNADGTLVRFHVEGDRRGTRNGWAVLFGDHVPAGEFGSWRTGSRHAWCAKSETTLNAAEQRAIRQRQEAARAERERQQREREEAAAKAANVLWNRALPADAHHPYLVRKGIHAHGLRVAAWPVRNSAGLVFRYIDNALLVPVMNAAGRIVSLQAIFPRADPALGRDKDFLCGGRKQGCFHVIGKPLPGEPIAIAEGYATAASIHQATGGCVVVAWDAGNLAAVARAWRSAVPDGSFVICADNDQWTRQPLDNPGVTHATRTAAEIDARVAWPEFTTLHGDDDRPTDFNDLHLREGLEAVRTQLFPLPPATTEEGTGEEDAPSPSNARYQVPGNLSAFDAFTPFPDTSARGRPLPTARNLAELCRRTGVTVRYNVIRKDLEILVPGLQSTVDNAKEVAAGEVMDCMHRAGMAIASFETNLCQVAEANPYNPVASWITSRPWDGQSRLQAFFDTVQEAQPTRMADGRVLKEVLMRRWLISGVAAAFEPDGVVARGVLTFVSKQNLGKTRWARQLAPAELQLIADGVVLDPASKDSVKQVISKWIVELGEVDATFRRTDIAALKSFISRSHDEIRRPYARTESRYARRTILFASVNDERFLRDATGNTRWWTVHAVGLGEPARIDMQQVWAEAHALYCDGETWHLSSEELDALNATNSEHEPISPIAELIDRHFDWSIPTAQWSAQYRATEIVIAVGIDKPNRREVNEAAAYVVKRHDVRTKVVGKERAKVWLMPPRKLSLPGHSAGPF